MERREGEGTGGEERTREDRKGPEGRRRGREREKGSEGEGGKENGDHPHTTFGLKVALFGLIDHVTLIFDPLTLKMMSESHV